MQRARSETAKLAREDSILTAAEILLRQSGYDAMTMQAVATAAGFGLAIAVPSALAWLFVSVDSPRLPWTFGAVNLPAFFVIIPMTFIFAPIGANVAHRMNAGPLKRLFGVFLLLVATNMVRSALWG